MLRSRPPAPQLNITLPDGTIIAPAEETCWTDPVAPPIASNSSNYAKGFCNVCVSQSLSNISSYPTIGIVHDFHVQIRDTNNHDMGSMNKTLAAFGGETGGKDTVIDMTVGGKQFHLWAMRDPGHLAWAAVYMDWAGPGPADPFRQPDVLFSAALKDSGVGIFGCGVSAYSPGNKRIYFQCGFEC